MEKISRCCHSNCLKILCFCKTVLSYALLTSLWERINLPISRNACSNIGEVITWVRNGPSCNGWTLLWYMRVAIHRRRVHTSEECPFLTQVIDPNLSSVVKDTSDVLTLPFLATPIHQSSDVWTLPFMATPIHRSSDVWTLQSSPTWVFFRLTRFQLMGRFITSPSLWAYLAPLLWLYG